MSIILYLCIIKLQNFSKLRSKSTITFNMNFKLLCMTALTGLILTGCHQSMSISGQLTDKSSDDSLLVIRNELRDTIAVPDGEFTYSLQGDQAQLVHFFNLPRHLSDGSYKAIRMIPISVLMFPDTELHLSGNTENYTITGHAFYDEYNPLKEKLQQLTREERTGVIRQYITEHPNSTVSLFLLHKYRIEGGEDFLDSFGDEVKLGVTRDLYNEIYKFYQVVLAKKEAAKFIEPGKPAPDFTLKDLKGQSFELSSLHDKYIVLDFWGSWCGWCIKGMPDMKKLYSKYQDKLEIVGINCRDSQEKWQAAVEKLQLPWVNVINDTDNDLTIRYNIQGFPTKIILSPDRKILNVVVGEDPEFYQLIENYMK